MSDKASEKLVSQLKDASSAVSTKMVKATSQKFDAMMDQLTTDFQQQRELLSAVRALAVEYRPVNFKAFAHIANMGAFCEAADKQYLAMFKMAVEGGKTSIAQKMLENLARHLDKCAEELKEVSTAYAAIAGKADAVAVKAADAAHDADMKKQADDHASNVGLGVGVGGLAAECGGAVALVALGSNPIGWAVLIGGATVGLSGLGYGAAAEMDKALMGTIEKNALMIKDTMALINAMIHKHQQELALIASNLNALAMSTTAVQDVMEDAEMVVMNIPILQSKFSDLKVSCQEFITTEQETQRMALKRLGLE